MERLVTEDSPGSKAARGIFTPPPGLVEEREEYSRRYNHLSPWTAVHPHVVRREKWIAPQQQTAPVTSYPNSFISSARAQTTWAEAPCPSHLSPGTGTSRAGLGQPGRKPHRPTPEPAAPSSSPEPHKRTPEDSGGHHIPQETARQQVPAAPDHTQTSSRRAPTSSPSPRRRQQQR